jgi:hypothetical protein
VEIVVRAGALETMRAEDGWILKGEEPGPESNGRD